MKDRLAVLHGNPSIEAEKRREENESITDVIERMLDETTDEPVDADVESRLEQRAGEDETIEEVVDRLLEATTEAVSLETVLADVMDHYDEVMSIYIEASVDRSNLSDSLVISVSTTDLGPYECEQSPLQYNSSKHRVSIETEAGQREFKFLIIADAGSPRTMEVRHSTPVYLAEDFAGDLGAIDLEEGIARFREKLSLAETHPEPREAVRTLIQEDQLL